MSTRFERELARQELAIMSDRLPAALRGPLRAVRAGIEVPGTARDVLRMAEDVRLKLANEDELLGPEVI